FANQQMFFTKLWLIGIAIFGVTLWCVLRARLGLAGIAAAAIVAPLVVVCGTIPRAYSFYGGGWRVQVLYAVRVVAPAVYVAAVHLICRAAFKDVLSGSAVAHEFALGCLTLLLTVRPLGLLAWHTFDVSRVWREHYEAS